MAEIGTIHLKHVLNLSFCIPEIDVAAHYYRGETFDTEGSRSPNSVFYRLSALLTFNVPCQRTKTVQCSHSSSFVFGCQGGWLRLQWYILMNILRLFIQDTVKKEDAIHWRLLENKICPKRVEKGKKMEKKVKKEINPRKGDN
ncbi:hypothetical protein UY3_16144 [Chelonia mydas]|uniref:Uncharacterized protein n=1 Tax=Chelonia mydas TaxID=8469 RepID=M7AQ64_CHEMY|nr:hypothetical protein UY3_16144 [Chelonia mydas]